MQLKPLRIAMWSGPRNISTALMRAFENRDDCLVWDEPLYGYYLDATGIAHPGTAEVIAAQGTDAAAIIAACAGGSAGGKSIFYQKHMTLHLLPQLDRGWLKSLQNCFLIREPEAVIASYAAVRSDATLDDIGFVQQAALFETVRNLTGALPIVIDSREFYSTLRPCCARSVRVSGSGLCRKCLAGRPAGATATASGPNTGTTQCGALPASQPIGKKHIHCRRQLVKSRRRPGRTTNRCSNTGYSHSFFACRRKPNLCKLSNRYLPFTPLPGRVHLSVRQKLF